MESQIEILVLTNFTSLVIFNYLPPCLSFWLSFLLLKYMPVIIFLNLMVLVLLSKKYIFLYIFICQSAWLPAYVFVCWLRLCLPKTWKAVLSKNTYFLVPNKCPTLTILISFFPISVLLRAPSTTRLSIFGNILSLKFTQIFT